MLENINQQIATEQGMAQYQMTSPEVQPIEEYDSHPDHEVQMARSELHRAAHCSIQLSKMLQHINEQQGLEGWVQAKITKAADYLDSVYHYLEYEMQHSNDEVSEDVGRIGTYGPGQSAGESAGMDSPSPSASPNKQPSGPGQASPENPNQPPDEDTGDFSPTPPSGGGTPVPTALNMLKMVRVGIDGKPVGAAITVPKVGAEIKQREGYQVIEDASGGASAAGAMGGGFGNGFANGGPGAITRTKKKKKIAEAEGVVHCSQCGKGFSSTGLKAPHHTGFSHCKDHKGMKVIAEDASSGASSAGGMAAGMGNGTGFASGGIGMQKRKKKVTEGGDYSPKARGIADGYYGRPPNPHKIVTDEQGKNVRVKLTDPAEVAEYMAGYKDDSFGSKDYGESVAEAGFSSGMSTPTMRAKTASKFGHDPDRAAPMYKANKYDPKTGLGGYVAPRGDTTDKSNILLQLKSNLDTATGKPLTFQDGSTLAIKPSIARTALAKIEGMRPVEKHETIKNLMTSKDAFVSFVKGQGESKETGPKFTGYWKGKDKDKPGKKMVGDA